MKELSLGTRQSTAHNVKLTSWHVNHENSSVGFTVEQPNVLSKPFRKINGTFQVYTGTVKTSSPDFKDASIEFSVSAGSINTENDERDKHLRSANYLAVQKNPVIKFRSVAFVRGSGDRYLLEGDIRIRGVSRRVVFDVTYQGVNARLKDPSARFSVRGKVNRHDFGLKGSLLSEILVGSEINIFLELEFLKHEL